MTLNSLAVKSLLNRKASLVLTIIIVAVSVSLLLMVERVRTQAKQSFAHTISGTSLIVGARTGTTQLLLYTIFRIGSPTNNIDYESFETFKNHPKTKWAIPLSLGDSHKGYRVLGTDDNYYKHYQYGDRQSLAMSDGQWFTQADQVVLGARVAQTLNYKVGDQIVLSHGIGSTSFQHHKGFPVTVSGVLALTGTPIDKTLHVSLDSIDHMHGKVKHDDEHDHQHEPDMITAFTLGLTSPFDTLTLQRQINTFKEEPLLAILPQQALLELWSMMGVAEQSLLLVTMFVVTIGLLGMLTSILASLKERRREMAILRSLGAKPRQIFRLLLSESFFLGTLGTGLGILLFYLVLVIAGPIIQAEYGLNLTTAPLSDYEWIMCGVVVGASVIIGLIPAFLAFRRSVADGMTIRV